MVEVFGLKSTLKSFSTKNLRIVAGIGDFWRGTWKVRHVGGREEGTG